MFTGIIQSTGEVLEASGGRFAIASPFAAETLALGASIACDGCCLTIVGVRPLPNGARFDVDVSDETLSKTTLGTWTAGRRINLERSLRAGDEMGGHIVTGHVDGVAVIDSIVPVGFSKVFAFRAPSELRHFLAPKGSVCLNGASLTVNEVMGDAFTVNFVPHTLEVTTWGERMAGDEVNFEVDVIARYVARLLPAAPKV